MSMRQMNETKRKAPGHVARKLITEMAKNPDKDIVVLAEEHGLDPSKYMRIVKRGLDKINNNLVWVTHKYGRLAEQAEIVCNLISKEIWTTEAVRQYETAPDGSKNKSLWWQNVNKNLGFDQMTVETASDRVTNYIANIAQQNLTVNVVKPDNKDVKIIDVEGKPNA